MLIHCAGCDEPIRLPDETSGNAIQCLKCKLIILIPEQAKEAASGTAWMKSRQARTHPKPIARIEISDRKNRLVYQDADGQFILDDQGKPTYGEWFVP